MELFLTAFPCCDWEALICNALHHYIVQNPKSLSPPKQHGCILRSWSTLGHLFSSSVLLPLPFPPFFLIKCILWLQMSGFLRLFLACRHFVIQRPFFFILYYFCTIKFKLAVLQVVQFSLKLYIFYDFVKVHSIRQKSNRLFSVLGSP